MKKKVIFAAICIIEIAYILFNTCRISSADSMGTEYKKDELTILNGKEIEGDAGDYDVLVQTPQVMLKQRGIYKITIYLTTNSESVYSELFTTDEEKATFLSTTWDAEDINHHQKQYSYDVYTGIDDIPVNVCVRLMATDPDKTLDVSYVNIDFENGHSLAYFLVCALVIFGIIDGLLYLIVFKTDKFKRVMETYGGVTTIAIATILIASIPILQFMIPRADDLTYHLMRIQGIADGVLSGEFPVKIHPTWFNGYGHAVGIYYGQILLYPLAALRIVGFPLELTYRIYIVFINALTFAIAFFCANKITKNQMIAVFTAVFYTMAPYRIMNLYKRAAVGEASGMTFLPLIILGVAMLYDYIETDDKDKAWVYLTIGATGILNTHSLSVVMLMIVGSFFIILNIKKTLQKDVLIQCVKFVMSSLLINLFFLVPLLDYMQKIRVEMDCRENDMARKALSISQVFDQVYNVKGYDGDYSVVDTMPFTIGVAVLLIIVIMLIIACKNRLEVRCITIMISCSITFAVSVVLTLNVFPYKMLMIKCRPIYDLLQRMEYPWRFLTIATVLSACLFMLTACMIDSIYGKKCLIFFSVIIVLITVLQSKNMEDRIVHEKWGAAYYNGNDICWGFTELVPDGTEVEQLYDTELLTSSEEVIAENMRKNGLDTVVHVRNLSNEKGYVQVPLLCYPYYRAEDGNGNQFEVVRGDYRKLCFGIPSGYEGDVHVYFHEPITWRVAEIISLVSLVMFITFLVNMRRHERG